MAIRTNGVQRPGASSVTEPAQAQEPNAARFGALALGLVAAITAIRLVAIFATDLNLYPDEAQYWLWSTKPAFGYVSKPPLIAWAVWFTTRFGDSEAWVRLAAPLFQALAGVGVWGAGRRLYGPRAGFLAALIYMLSPGAQVAGLFIATDALLLGLLALALWAYVAMVEAQEPRRRTIAAALFGLALGAAFLAKQAAIYAAAGAVLHSLADRQARRVIGWRWMLWVGAAAVVLAPNLAWQASHNFATVTHTATVNAAWGAGGHSHLGKLAEFLAGQFGVFGPAPLVALVIASWQASRPRGDRRDRMLLWFLWPAIILVAGQAFISRAHAHWAAASYVPASVLVAGAAIKWRSRALLIWTVAPQALVAGLATLAVGWPAVADAAGQARRFDRQRGWAATAQAVCQAQDRSPPFDIVAVEDRYLFNELAYYGRACLTRRLAMRIDGTALNEAQLAAPLLAAPRLRALVVEVNGKTAPALPGEFSRFEHLSDPTVVLSAGRERNLAIGYGTGYLGPVSGRPTPP